VNSARIQTQSAPGWLQPDTRWTFSPRQHYPQHDGTAPPGPSHRARRIAWPSGSLASFLDGQTVNVALRAFVNNATVSPAAASRFAPGQENNLNGPNDDLSRRTARHRVARAEFGKLNLEFSYNQQNQNQQRMDGASRTRSTRRHRTGRITRRAAYQFKQFGNKDNNFRVLASYPIKLGWMRQFFVASYESLKDAAYISRYTLGKSRVCTLTNNDIKYRVYLDNPGTRRGVLAAVPADNLPAPNLQARWRSATTANRPFWDVRYSHTYACPPMAFTGRRFRTLLGVRHDQFNRKLTTVPRRMRSAVSRIPEVPRITEGLLLRSGVDQTATSVSAGLVYSVVRTSISTFVFESFNWQLTTISRAIRSGPISARIARRREDVALRQHAAFHCGGVSRRQDTRRLLLRR